MHWEWSFVFKGRELEKSRFQQFGKQPLGEIDDSPPWDGEMESKA
jgi:hypothetical protein